MLDEGRTLFPSYKGLKADTLGWLMAALIHHLFWDLGSLQSPFCHSWAMALVHIVQDGCLPSRQHNGEEKGMGEKKGFISCLLTEVSPNCHKIVSLYYIGKNLDIWQSFVTKDSGICSLYRVAHAVLKFVTMEKGKMSCWGEIVTRTSETFLPKEVKE